MNQKVICIKAHECEEADGCEHSTPHEVEIFNNQPDGSSWKCTDWDECLDYKIRCQYIGIGIDFELDGMFYL